MHACNSSILRVKGGSESQSFLAIQELQGHKIISKNKKKKDDTELSKKINFTFMANTTLNYSVTCMFLFALFYFFGQSYFSNDATLT